MWDIIAILIIVGLVIAYWPFIVAVIIICILIAVNRNRKHKKILINQQQTNTQTNNRDDYDSMTGYDFESYCAKTLKECNFKNVSITSKSGDNGVDIKAKWKGKKIVIQCKRYSSSIGNKAAQEVFTGKTMYRADIAVVLTNQYFTKSAKETAHKTSVLLWDRDKLDILKSYRNKHNDERLAKELRLPIK